MGWIKYFLFLLMFLYFTGCEAKKDYILFQDVNTTKNRPQSKAKKFVYEYKIMPGDRLSIVVFNHPELSTNNKSELEGVMVFPDGTIELPLIGKVKVAGLTTKEATEKIQKLYAEYLKKPYVKLEVISKKVYVLGEVKQPGIVHVSSDYTTLIDVISQRGGFTDMARRNNIIIISGGLDNPKVRQIDLTKISSLNFSSLVLKPNDIVYVQPMNLKPYDVQVQGISPIVNLINSIFSTFANIKYISK